MADKNKHIATIHVPGPYTPKAQMVQELAAKKGIPITTIGITKHGMEDPYSGHKSIR